MNAAGDYCLLLFDSFPFDVGSGVTISQVYDALRFYVTNMEISITEVQGVLMLREGDESSAFRPLDVSQTRLVSGKLHSGVSIETNSLEFCHFFDADSVEAKAYGGGRELAVVVGDFVDEDELFPYSPETRARHDVTGAIVVSLEPRPKQQGRRQGGSRGSDGHGDDDDLVVVLKRVGFLTVRATELPVAPEGMEELRQCVEGWADAMIQTVRSLVKPPNPWMAEVDVTQPEFRAESVV